VFTGTHVGTRLLERARAARVRIIFAVLLIILGVAMAARVIGFGGVL